MNYHIFFLYVITQIIMIHAFNNVFHRTIKINNFKRFCIKAIDTNSNAIEGHVYMVATPLGNLKDITNRSIDILSSVDVICAEDTRLTKKLLNLLNISYKNKQIISLHEHNWKTEIPVIIKLIKESNTSVAVVTDAGTPGIADPGAEFVAELHKEKINIHPIPGASAVAAAISVCGFPSSCFTFYGFLPPKGNERKVKLQKIIDTDHTSVIFEAPHRIIETLEDLKSSDENREIVLCRELTKLHEEIIRGKPQNLLNHISNTDTNKVKGEFTLVIGPNNGTSTSNEKELNAEKLNILIRKMHDDNVPRSEAVRLISDMFPDISKSKIYKLALQIEEW